jgi:hypothetical protein
MTPLRVSIFAAVAALLLLFVIFELIRSRRLQERYAMLWLLTGIVILILGLWRGCCRQSPTPSALPTRRRRFSCWLPSSSCSCFCILLDVLLGAFGPKIEFWRQLARAARARLGRRGPGRTAVRR